MKFAQASDVAPLSPARRLVIAAVSTALAAVLTLAGPAVVPAFADVDAPPRPVTVPGSAYKGDKITPLGNGSWYNRGISGNPNAFVNSVGGSILTKRSVPYMVMQGANLAYTFSTGAQAADLKMHDPLTWAACTITLGVGDPCAAPLVKAGAYVPNSDVANSAPPGWSVTPVSPTQWLGSNTGIQMTVVSAVESAVNGSPTFTLTWLTSSGTYPALGAGNKSLPQPQFRTTSGGLVGPTNSGPATMGDVGEHTVTWVGPPGSSLYAWNVAFRFQVDGVWSPTDWVATYFGLNNPARPAGVSGDPRRMFETRWECSEGSGGVSSSSWFHETDAAFPSLPAASCTVGEVIEYTISLITEGLADKEVMYTWRATAEYVDYITDWANHPDKDAVVDLGIVGTAGGEVMSCFADPSKCVGWYDKTDKGQTMRCTKGATVLPLEDCNQYRPTFDPDKVAKGQTYADPRDAALPDPKPAPTDPAPAPSGNACFPSGWNVFNPIEWVLKPVSCALTWAFIPSAATQAKITSVQTLATTRAPIPQLRSLFVWLEPPALARSCGAFSMPIWFIDKSIPVLDTCNPNDPAMKMLAPLRPLLTVVVWIGMFAPLAWWAWREYAPGSKGVA